MRDGIARQGLRQCGKSSVVTNSWFLGCLRNLDGDQNGASSQSFAARHIAFVPMAIVLFRPLHSAPA